MKKNRAARWTLLLGFSVSAVTTLLAIFSYLPSWVTPIFVWPGFKIAPFLAIVIPSQVFYWLVPEGGGSAFILLVVIGAFIVWALVFTAIALAVYRVWGPNNSFKADGSAAA